MKLVVQVSVILLVADGHAQEMQEFYTGVRQQAMGGAYTCVVNDETALLTNPAGLGKIRGYIATLADPELSFGGTTTDVATATTYTTVLTPQGLLDSLNSQRGKHFHAKAQIFPSAVFTNFGIGFHAKYKTDAEVDATGTNYTMHYWNDFAAVFGFNFRLWNGIIKMGFAGRLTNRVEVDSTIPANSTGLTLQSMASEGLGFGADGGITLTSPTRLLPSLSVVVRDWGNTKYTLSPGFLYGAANRPKETPQTVDAGLAIFPIFANHMRMSLTLDYHNILTVSKDTENGAALDPFRRAHVGMELNFHDFMFLRAGMNQRYWSGGFEIATQRFQIQGSSYGEEIGTAAAPREDRRYVGKLSVRF